jgi:hypothetical protein
VCPDVSLFYYLRRPVCPAAAVWVHLVSRQNTFPELSLFQVEKSKKAKHQDTQNAIVHLPEQTRRSGDENCELTEVLRFFAALTDPWKLLTIDSI